MQCEAAQRRINSSRADLHTSVLSKATRQNPKTPSHRNGKHSNVLSRERAKVAEMRSCVPQSSCPNADLLSHMKAHPSQTWSSPSERSRNARPGRMASAARGAELPSDENRSGSFSHPVEDYRKCENPESVGGCDGNASGPIADVTRLLWIPITYYSPRSSGQLCSITHV